MNQSVENGDAAYLLEGPTITCRLLSAVGVPHAFTTRLGGVSTGMFQSLNFGNPGDLPADQRDPPTNIRSNFDRVMKRIGGGTRRLVEVHQVHGADVRVVSRDGPDHETPDGRDTKADALVTDDPCRIIAVRVADCTPVLLSSADGRVVSSVHAGWRGVVGGVLPQAVRAMVDRGVTPTDIIAAIGPCIGPECFEIGPEVVEEFERCFGKGTPIVKSKDDGSDRAHADLQAALARQCLDVGLRPDRVEMVRLCTACHPELFFSHRRDQGKTGRMIGLIGPR